MMTENSDGTPSRAPPLSMSSPFDLSSLPSPPLSSQGMISTPSTAVKPHRNASVTPRTFKRFFTPRSALSKVRNNAPLRGPLFTVSGSAANARAQLHIGSDPFPDVDVDRFPSPESLKKRKRQAAFSSPIRPTQDKKARRESITDDVRPDIFSDITIHEDAIIEPPPRIKKANCSNLATRVLGRSTMEHGVKRHKSSQCADWESLVEGFYSAPSNIHVCKGIGEGAEPETLPFCTSGCNTNSLVAVGDESGGIRLLDTDENGRKSFDEPLSSFKPHMNAIMDLCFSENDARLATASGDQSARVIDMPTQKVTSILQGHSSSVKVIKFQPGQSGQVVASAARDGKVMIWDLRCTGPEAPPSASFVAFDQDSQPLASPTRRPATYGRYVNSLMGAHADAAVVSNDLRAVSITGLAFLPAGREHLLMTSCEADACVKLWDLRMNYSARQKRLVPLSTTRQPANHHGYRKFGLTSLALNSSGSRLYGLCRDNTVYTYATSHLILGDAPELAPASSRRRFAGDKTGIAPLYGFRHPLLHASTFYIKLALRTIGPNEPELLAVGSGDGCAVVFPTDEVFQSKAYPSIVDGSYAALERPQALPIRNKARTTTPTHSHGMALLHGHTKEVSDLTWTSEGNLVTVGDDKRVRLWKEGSDADRLRRPGIHSSDSWNWGWAEFGSGVRDF